MNYEIGNNFMSDCDLRKILTVLKLSGKLNWLNNYSDNIAKQAVKDACNAYENFFRGLTKYPSQLFTSDNFRNCKPKTKVYCYGRFECKRNDEEQTSCPSSTGTVLL